MSAANRMSPGAGLRVLSLVCLVVCAPSCGRPSGAEGAQRTDCMTWRNTRYCFPSTISTGIASSAEKVSAGLRIPLTSSELQRCNADHTALDWVAYDYPNVDVSLTSLSPGVSPREIYDIELQSHLGAGRPPLSSAGKARCWNNRPEHADSGITCLERQLPEGDIYVTSCSAPDGIGLPSCLDTHVSNTFETRVFASRSCYSERMLMRTRVRNFINAHRSEING